MLTKEKIEYYYRHGLWSRRRVLDALARGRLTAEEAAAILQEPIKEDKI